VSEEEECMLDHTTVMYMQKIEEKESFGLIKVGKCPECKEVLGDYDN